MVNYFKVDYKKRTISIDKKLVTLINMIKILLNDGYYYSELEYIPPYHCYEVFNQL